MQAPFEERAHGKKFSLTFHAAKAMDKTVNSKDVSFKLPWFFRFFQRALGVAVWLSLTADQCKNRMILLS